MEAKPSRLSAALRGTATLYGLGGSAALLLLAYFLVTMIIMIVLGPPPSPVEDILAMLEKDQALGLLRLDVLRVLFLPLCYPLLLSLCAALGRTKGDFAALAAVLGWAGVTLVLAAPSPVSLVPIGKEYVSATSEARSLQLLAASESFRAFGTWHGTGALLGSALLQIAATLVSVIMLWDDGFGELTAALGILTHGLVLAHIVAELFLPGLGIILMAMVGPLYLIWFPLLARDLFRLGRKQVAE